MIKSKDEAFDPFKEIKTRAEAESSCNLMAFSSDRGGEFNSIAFRKYITSLPKMDRIPQGIVSLRSLKKLWLLDLHRNFLSKWVTYGMHQRIMHVPEVCI